MRQPECLAAGQLRLPGDCKAGVPVGSGLGSGFEVEGQPSKGGYL